MLRLSGRVRPVPTPIIGRPGCPRDSKGVACCRRSAGRPSSFREFGAFGESMRRTRLHLTDPGEESTQNVPPTSSRPRSALSSAWAASASAADSASGHGSQGTAPLRRWGSKSRCCASGCRSRYSSADTRGNRRNRRTAPLPLCCPPIRTAGRVAPAARGDAQIDRWSARPWRRTTDSALRC